MKTIALLSLVLLASCGGSKKSSSKASTAENPNTVARPTLEDLSYKFDGTIEGTFCSTGKHRFTSLPLLCLSLQNDAKNKSCAFNERYDMFREYCEPNGFKWIESINCEVLVVKPEVRVPDYGAVGYPGAVLFERKFCAGRMEERGAENLDGVELNFEVVPKWRMNIAVSPSYEGASVVLTLRGNGQDINRSYQDVEFMRGLMRIPEASGEQVVVTCEKTWGCPARRRD